MTNKRKRNSLVAEAVEGTEHNEGNEDTSTDARAPKSTVRPRKTPRRRVEIIEIESDEEECDELPRLTGPLRGLNPKNMISPTQPSTEAEHYGATDVVENTQSVRHVTRQSRHGKSAVNYDMKYHPADEVMRPKRAAKRRSTSELPEDDAETDEESLPSSARSSDASSESHSDEASDQEVEVVPRMPDARATRHSGRTATQKAVNYSSKHHPQDFALPGFQHKAKARKKLLKDAKQSVSSTPKPAKIRKSAIDLTEEASDEESEAEEPKDEESTCVETAPEMEQKSQSPREQLRTLTDSRKRGKGKKANIQKVGTDTSSDVVNLLGSVNEPALTSSEAAELRRLKQKIRNHRSTQRHVEETQEDPADGFPMFADLNSSQNPKIRQYDDDDDDANMFTFMDHGHSSDEATGEADVANKQTGTKTNDTATRRDSHQSQDHPPPSQFDEQLAVTEIRSKEPDENTSEDLMSGLEASLRGDPLRDGDPSQESAKSDGHDTSPTTDRSDSTPKEDVKSSNMHEASSVADKDLYKTPDTNHGGSNHGSKQHSKSDVEQTTSDRYPTHLARANTDPRLARPSVRAEDMPPPDLDDALLRHLRSSQRSRSDVLMETDPTSGNNSDERSDDRTDSE